jgi:hypothetical protein
VDVDITRECMSNQELIPELNAQRGVSITDWLVAEDAFGVGICSRPALASRITHSPMEYLSLVGRSTSFMIKEVLKIVDTKCFNNVLIGLIV